MTDLGMGNIGNCPGRKILGGGGAYSERQKKFKRLRFWQFVKIWVFLKFAKKPTFWERLIYQTVNFHSMKNLSIFIPTMCRIFFLNLPLEISKILWSNDLYTVFLNINITNQMFTCPAVTNYTAKRSFSCLKKVKSYLHSSMMEDRLNNLAISCTE